MSNQSSGFDNNTNPWGDSAKYGPSNGPIVPPRNNL